MILMLDWLIILTMIMEYLKTRWWDLRDEHSIFQWAKNGSALINSNEEELRIVFLFKE